MSVVSTNPFDLLPDNATSGEVSVSAVKKPQTQKKTTQGPRPERAQPTPVFRSGYPARGARRGGSTREPVRAAEPVEEQERRPRAPHASQRGRGAPRGRGRQFDRHSGTGLVDSDKKQKQGWLGAPEDMPADEASAAAEAAKDAQDGAMTPMEEEPEEVVKSLDDYLGERAKSSIDSKRELRKANEGVAQSALKQGVELNKTEEDFFAPTIVRKSRKNRERKEKVFVNEITQQFNDQTRGAFRGGRGGRSDRRPNTRQAHINLGDKNAFPSL
ncbi:hypothetical protein IWW50_004039 [Coemansia erecta]|nr:hypothetical protein GGF43_004662 [Coemansia sp. RSA 2618]KAJ2822847.1 hypothetical protein IWW50_004039 [Coemansia erecta]